LIFSVEYIAGKNPGEHYSARKGVKEPEASLMKR
jgi:hypothetical protein